MAGTVVLCPPYTGCEFARGGRGFIAALGSPTREFPDGNYPAYCPISAVYPK